MEQAMRLSGCSCFLGLLCAITVGCTSTDSPPEDMGPTFTLKMHQSTGENPFAQLAYECRECSFEQFAAIEPPSGWSKGPSQVILPEGELRSTPSLDGVPSSMDFVPDIPGEEFELIAKTLDGRVVEIGAHGLMVVVDVMRDPLFRFPAESRVHELTDPDENIFVLFAYEVETEDSDSPDFEAADALAGYPLPGDWLYSTRTLDEELFVESDEVTTVLSISGEIASVWQQR